MLSNQKTFLPWGSVLTFFTPGPTLLKDFHYHYQIMSCQIWQFPAHLDSFDSAFAGKECFVQVNVVWVGLGPVVFSSINFLDVFM